MKKSLASPFDNDRIRQRIASLTPDSPRQWGKMSVGGMICHLHDSFELGLGERHARPISLPIPKGLIKVVALGIPIPWPKNLMTMPEVRQGAGGTPPGIFVDDRARLLDVLARFAASQELDKTSHPLFGKISRADWLRWGYLHADHHLRQFGA